MPLTDYALTKTALMVESAPGLEDWHPLDVDYGEIAVSLPGYTHLGTRMHARTSAAVMWPMWLM